MAPFSSAIPWSETPGPEDGNDEEEEEEPFDWFVNTLTGEVVHDPSKVKGDESKLGENYEHLATESEISIHNVDGIFDESNFKFLSGSKNILAIKYNLETSRKIMESNDRVLVPRETVSYTYRDTNGSTILPSGTQISIINLDISEIWSDLTYVPNNYIKEFNNIEVNSITGIAPGVIRTVTTNKINYHKPNFWEKALGIGSRASDIYQYLTGNI